jgi:hypothetical protein
MAKRRRNEDALDDPREHANDIRRMTAEGWLIPIKGESLPLGDGDYPQRWRARRPEDGELPRFYRR